jgi:hypothetical protein
MKERKLAITMSLMPKVDKLLRRQADKAGLNLGEMVAVYQLAYTEKLEREKQEKKET